MAIIIPQHCFRRSPRSWKCQLRLKKNIHLVTFFEHSFHVVNLMPHESRDAKAEREKIEV